MRFAPRKGLHRAAPERIQHSPRPQTALRARVRDAGRARALALAEPGQWLGPEMLSTRLHDVLEPIEAATIEGESLRESLGRLEAWLIRRTLERADGRRAETGDRAAARDHARGGAAAS